MNIEKVKLIQKLYSDVNNRFLTNYSTKLYQRDVAVEEIIYSEKYDDLIPVLNDLNSTMDMCHEIDVEYSEVNPDGTIQISDIMDTWKHIQITRVNTILEHVYNLLKDPTQSFYPLVEYQLDILQENSIICEKYLK